MAQSTSAYPTNTNRDWIQLNIGGTVFLTTKTTLQNGDTPHFLGRLITHSRNQKMIFVDRDPTHFRHVLNYLRTQTFPSEFEHQHLQMLRELQLEADFYQIENLCKAVGRTINSLRSSRFDKRY